MGALNLLEGEGNLLVVGRTNWPQREPVQREIEAIEINFQRFLLQDVWQAPSERGQGTWSTLQCEKCFPWFQHFFCYCTDPHNSGQQPDDGIDPRHNRLELEVLRCLCKVKELLQESFVQGRQKVKCTNVASADFLRWSKIFVARAHLWHAVNYWTELSKYCQSRKCLITQRSPIQQVLFANDGNQLDGLASCKGDCPYNIFLQRIVIRWMGRPFAK